MSKKIVLVDMDGVLSDFDRRFIEIWRNRYPTRPQLDQGNRTSFKIAKEFPVSLQSDIRAVFTEPGFYLSLPVIRGAIKGMRDMHTRGLDVWICTSPRSEYENCVLEKYKWVEIHLGKKWTERIIMTRNKAMIHGDILIDDNPYIYNVDSAPWEHILFDAPYNRDIDNLKRITWQNWSEVLKEYLI